MLKSYYDKEIVCCPRFFDTVGRGMAPPPLPGFAMIYTRVRA